MAKKAPQKKSNPRKSTSKNAKTTQSSNICELRSIREEQVTKYNTVKNTESAYKGHMGRGRIFIASLVAQKRESGDKSTSDGIDIEKLAKAFDNPPNDHSALALELTLVQRCHNEMLGVSTATSIHAAFCSYWDNMDGERYAGPYQLDEKTGGVHGNPARAANVKAVIQSVKTRAKSKGQSATRSHADAITIEELKSLMDWSTKECPDELLVHSQQIEDTETLKFRMEHGFMRAFMSSAFTLWTRCFELLSLQAGDIKENCQGPAPFNIPHFKVHLNNRKGWQHEKGYDGPRTSNIYDIYKQDQHELDMSLHLTQWKEFLEGHLGEKLKPEDYLFPHIGTNGVIRTAQQMSYDGLQGLLTKFCCGAGGGGVIKRYTTHSFRRSGAQYRFMFAPLGQRWSLNRVRWWGGWAVGEHVDTLIKYLVDSLQSYENGHGYALHPTPLEPNISFMGDHVAIKTVTNEDLRQFSVSIDRKLDLLTSELKSGQKISGLLPTVYSGAISTISSMDNQSFTARSVPLGTATTDHIPGFSSTHAFTPQDQSSISSQKAPVPLPIPRVSIPSLGRAPGAWRRAIKQWEEIDPATGSCLRDWPSKWYRGNMRTVIASKRGQRQLVFEEFERLGRDEDRFLDLYPDADRSVVDLMLAIRIQQNKRRTSKNGPPGLR